MTVIESNICEAVGEVNLKKGAAIAGKQMQQIDCVIVKDCVSSDWITFYKSLIKKCGAIGTKDDKAK